MLLAFKHTYYCEALYIVTASQLCFVMQVVRGKLRGSPGSGRGKGSVIDGHTGHTVDPADLLRLCITLYCFYASSKSVSDKVSHVVS